VFWYWYKAGIASGIPSWCVLQYQYPYQYYVPSYTLSNGITLGIYIIANAPKYLTLRSVLSVNNPQNNEMKFCENMKLTTWVINSRNPLTSNVHVGHFTIFEPSIEKNTLSLELISSLEINETLQFKWCFVARNQLFPTTP
jgi:hypothetical protein